MYELEIAFLKAKDEIEIEHDDYEIINDSIKHVQKLMAEINSEDKS
ncbi:MAG: hypothetical protein ACK4M7_05335 [Burkholderiales bacterium]